jgi:hypothetical protein
MMGETDTTDAEAANDTVFVPRDDLIEAAQITALNTNREYQVRVLDDRTAEIVGEDQDRIKSERFRVPVDYFVVDHHTDIEKLRESNPGPVVDAADAEVWADAMELRDEITTPTSRTVEIVYGPSLDDTGGACACDAPDPGDVADQLSETYCRTCGGSIPN